jgi:tripartite-type tricarboxylate transporter receptor subunit TctC
VPNDTLSAFFAYSTNSFRLDAPVFFAAITSPPMPDVPTFLEQGATGKIFSLRGFTGLAAPTGVPADIIKKMGDMIVAANDDPKVKQVLTSFLLEPATKIDVAQARFKEESPLILDALKSLGIKPEQ